MTTVALRSQVPLARRQIAAKRGRTLAGLVGIAAALLLVLALNAIFAGIEGRLTGYIDRSGADVIVAQEGVQTMHMTQSALTEGHVGGIAGVEGVGSATPILYKSVFIERGDKSGVVALIGGGPIPGTAHAPAGRGIVIDEALAEQLGVGIGDTVRVLGTDLRIAGEITGTAAITGSFAFVARPTLARLLHAKRLASYVLVRARPGTSGDELAQRINAGVPGVTASTRNEFAISERRVVGDMTTDIVRAMTFVGFVIGVAVAGLVAYSATLTQLRDVAVLHALGLTTRRALTVAGAQVGLLIVGGFALALALVAALAAIAPLLSPTLVLSIRLGDVVQAAAVAGAVALVAALVPIVRVAHVEPASVFRRSS
jgi:putative ABC transport system permease protein